MRKLFLFSAILCVFSCCPVSHVWAQDVRTQAREAEWQSYSVPKTNFIRQTSPGKDFIFRLPADWKPESDGLTFNAPHSSRLKITIEKVSDGVPLAEFVTGIMRIVRGTPGAAESAILRRTQIQDLEAREIVLDLPDVEGEITRAVTWVTVQGPLAVAFILHTPLAHAAEVEPFFKGVVQSLMFVHGYELAGFESLRSTTIKPTAPSPIYEPQTIIASLQEKSDREPAIARLASMFASTPDVVIDPRGWHLWTSLKNSLQLAIFRGRQQRYLPALWRSAVITWMQPFHPSLQLQVT